MKGKSQRVLIFVSLAILVCSLFVACTRKSTKQEVPPPTWSDIVRDYQYLPRTFYDLGYADDFAPGDSILEIKLFKSNHTINSNTQENLPPFGIAYVDPEDISASYPEGYFHRRFLEVNPNDYFVQRNQFWIQLFDALQANDILAAFSVIRRSDATFDTVGYLKDSCISAEEETCMTLKLIKPDAPRPTDYTWDYEWKNVYYLGARNIEREGFSLNIYKGLPYVENINEDPNHQDGTPFLRILGLDLVDLNGDPNPDGVVDYRQIDFGLGYLIFPNRHPFAPDPNQSFTGNPADTLKEKVESIYYGVHPQQPREDSKYYIYVELDTSKSTYYLARTPPMERAEEVTPNDRPLSPGGNGHLIRSR